MQRAGARTTIYNFGQPTKSLAIHPTSSSSELFHSKANRQRIYPWRVTFFFDHFIFDILFSTESWGLGRHFNKKGVLDLQTAFFSSIIWGGRGIARNQLLQGDIWVVRRICRKDGEGYISDCIVKEFIYCELWRGVGEVISGITAGHRYHRPRKEGDTRKIVHD